MKERKPSQADGGRRLRIAIRSLTAIGLVIWVVVAARGQDDTTLGDVARRSRERKTKGQQSPSKAQELVEEMQQEQEEAETAPIGFKTYNGGDYRVWVPFPFEIRDRDDAGIVLAGSLIGGTKSLVMVGNAIPFSSIYYYGGGGNPSDSDLRNFSSQFARRFSPGAGCGESKIGPRPGYRCSIYAKAYLGGEDAGGWLVLVRGSNSLFPVMCVVPNVNHGRDAINHPIPGYTDYRQNVKEMVREDQDARNSWHACDLVLQSIRLKEDIVPASMTAAKTGTMTPATAKPAIGELPISSTNTPAGSANGNTMANSGQPMANSGQPSVAEIARRQREASAQAPKAKLAMDSTGGNGLAPPGFKQYSFNFCKNQGLPCWYGSVVVPADAQQHGSDCGAPFETTVDGEPLWLYAGAGADPAANIYPCSGRMGNAPDVVRWFRLADPDGATARGSKPNVGNQQITVDGKLATVMQFQYKDGAKDWIGKRADLESNGVALMVGCLAPKDHFADAEAVCTTLIDSLRVP